MWGFEPMELKLLCIMDFSAYPMDTQSCVYKVIPEFGAMSGVRAKWLWLGSGHEFSTRFEAPNLDYTATIRYRNGLLRYQLVNITYPEFEIKLVRKYRSHLIETIVPTGLLVAISWVNHGNNSSNEMDRYLFHFHFDCDGRIRLHPDGFGLLGGKCHKSSVAQKQDS